MENQNQLKDLFSIDDTPDEKKIIDELLSDDNLDKKTELSQPIRWSILYQIEKLCGKWQLTNSSILLNSFINTSFRYLISKDRKSRAEFIEALKALKSLEKEKVEAFDMMKR